MGKKKEKTKIFIQRRYTNDQWAYEKILDIISNDRNSIKTAMMYYCILTRMALINKRTTINFSDDVEKLKPSDLAVEM